MTEAELRRIVEEVVKTLAGKGLLQSPAGAPPSKGLDERPIKKSSGQVTMGTAGKVFSSEWSYAKTPAASPAAPGGAAAPPCRLPEGLSESRPGLVPLKDAEEDDHTCCSSCPQCEPCSRMSEGELKAFGADRVGVCHPTKKGSAVAGYVDHTLLKPNATQEEIAVLCAEAKSYCFASVCINPSYVPLAAKLLAGSGVKVCTVVGFPLGSTTSTVKAIEARDAIAGGAHEIDMVINVGALKSGNDAAVLEDIKAVREATRGRVLKVILETSLLSDDEKTRACLLSKQAGADFVKTSTGFGGGGATVEDIRLMRTTVGPLMGVKASGGIRDAQAADAMIKAGATRLGTSASVAIVGGTKAEGKGY